MKNVEVNLSALSFRGRTKYNENKDYIKMTVTLSIYLFIYYGRKLSPFPHPSTSPPNVWCWISPRHCVWSRDYTVVKRNVGKNVFFFFFFRDFPNSFLILTSVFCFVFIIIIIIISLYIVCFKWHKKRLLKRMTQVKKKKKYKTGH